MAKIAVLDDDDQFRDYLETLLGAHGHQVYAFATPGKFLDALSQLRPDLIVLDLELPRLSGWDLLKTLKGGRDFNSIAVILISAQYKRAQELVRGLEMGADDYVTKPFNPDLFLARVDAAIRRSFWRAGNAPPETLVAGPLVMSPAEHWVRINGRSVELTRLEFELLAYMVKNPDRVLTRGHILERVWQVTSSLTTRTVDRHVASLRAKLGSFGSRIQTIIKTGYVFSRSGASSKQQNISPLGR